MAFVGMSFIKPGKQAKARARGAVKYNTSRPGKQGEQIDRTAFGHDGPLTKEQIETMITDAPQNTYFWNMIVSPDPNGEENSNRQLNLPKLTKDLVAFLERRLDRQIEFIAAVQNDHTDIPHVHALLLIQRRGREMLITVKTLEDLQSLAAGKALDQQSARSQARPFVAVASLVKQQTRPQSLSLDEPQPLTGAMGGRARRYVATRPLQLCNRCDKPWTKYHECEAEAEEGIELERKR